MTTMRSSVANKKNDDNDQAGSNNGDGQYQVPRTRPTTSNTPSTSASAAASTMASSSATARCNVPPKTQVLGLFISMLLYLGYSTSYMTYLMQQSNCGDPMGRIEMEMNKDPSQFGGIAKEAEIVTTDASITTINPYKAIYEELQQKLQQQKLEFEDQIRLLTADAADSNRNKEAANSNAKSTIGDNDNVDPILTPAYWLETSTDDYLGRTYVDASELSSLRPSPGHKFFHPVCGLYRFNTTQMPKVSVIVTVQHELQGAIPMTVHSVLARTPPELLEEIILVDDNGQEPGERPAKTKKAGAKQGAVQNDANSIDGSGGGNDNDNDLGGDEDDIDPSEREIQEMTKLPKVKVITNRLREGCARSRLIGAKAAKGEVLVFIDSHVEMESGTWLEHLLLPILENPKTLSMQVIDGLGDLGAHNYSNPATPSYGKINEHFFFGYNLDRFSEHGKVERPGSREPFETPFGPGSLFAMRQDEFWRLGGYDEGIYIWGAENTELAMKTWMCGGRVVMVPCSRVGHIYRIHIHEVGHWPPHVPQRLIDELNLHNGTYRLREGKADDFTKVVTRNNMRVLEVWAKDHPAKDEFYKISFGSADPSKHPEWYQFIKEMKDDPRIQKQIQHREANKCKNFEWFDKYVYTRLLGVHHPWHPTSVREGNPAVARVNDKLKRLRKMKEKDQPPHKAVSCGMHRAANCLHCPKGHGALWCNGDCEWIAEKHKCAPLGSVTCGQHTALSCKECTKGYGESWCNGECRWNSTSKECMPRPSNTHPVYRRLVRHKPFQPVVDQDDNYVNIAMVRTPFKSDKASWDLFHEYKDKVLFLGISSFENFPLPGPNPWSEKYAEDTYTPLFPGFLHNMRDPEKHFPSHVKHVLMAQSDWIEAFPKIEEPKLYDFSYSGSNQEVKTNCDGWSSYNKNWTFVQEALDVMCDLNMTGVLFASKLGNMTCTIPKKCEGLIKQTQFLGQSQMFKYIRQSRFVFLPQISDASPRVAAQALALDTPILMNKHIFGGWKYVNNQTGEFFTDMSDLQQQFTKILQNQDQYHPRDWWGANYGADRLAKRFTKYVKDNFAELAQLPPNTTKLTPIFT